MASPADIKSIFLAASEKPLPERAAFLREACGDDSVLRHRVEALLKAHDNTGGWLGEGATPTSDYPGFSAPSIEALAPHFPQLEILELLGQGGMGAVYKARQKNLDRLVALKILPHESGDRGFAERFTREARTLAKLNHPGIVAVHDFGSSGELYWFVMEYVDGVNLRQARKAGTLTPAAALAVVPKICEALQFAHDAGIVHRDIKPENVLLDAKGRVKIADFGLAKLVGRPDRSHLTGTHQAMGTPHYMAPEQWEKPLEVDHRADIYSLGVVFYELLTGELPMGRFAPPSQKVQVDVRLDEVVLRTLEKEPARRYQQASELKTDVERIGSGPSLPASVQTVPKAKESGFFRRVLLLPLIIAFVGILALVVYAIFPEEKWDKGVRENITALTVISVWISGCVLVLNLGLWYITRQQKTLIGTLTDGKRLLYRLPPSYLAIPVCALGMVNAVLPWWVTQTTFSSTEWYTGFTRLWGYKPLFLNSLWMPLGLFLLATGGQVRLRFWRGGALLLVGTVILVTSILFIDYVWPAMRRNELSNLWRIRIFLGPYIAAGLSALLMLLGALELRSWLAERRNGA